MLNREIIILDTTLRDGEQQPGVTFSLDDKFKIASFLNEVGVPEVEVGTPSIGPKVKEEISRIVNGGFNFKSIVWSRANTEDILGASQIGATRIHLSLPVSDIHLNAMGKSRAWVREVAKKTIECAQCLFEEVSIGLQDASRSQPDFIDEIVNEVQNLGVCRLRYADTVGCLTPSETELIFKNLKQKHSKVEWEFHGHNDFGLATANAYSALLGGAHCVNVTLGGIGERAGNTPLEEFAMLVQIKNGDCKGIDSSKFCEIDSLLVKNAGVVLGANKPIIGKNCFVHKTGIHQNLLLKDPKTYQSILAEQTGRTEMKFIFDKHSGVHAVEFYLQKSGAVFSSKELADFMVFMKRHSTVKKVSWEGEELHQAFIHWRMGELIEAN